MALVQQSYDRICKLSVFQTLALPAGPNGQSLSQIDPKGFTFPSKLADGSPAYRIKFNVQKTTAGPVPQPHPTIIHIYNLGETNRKLFAFNAHVILQAGYGDSAKTIASGEIQYAVTYKEGPDYVTEIHLGDGVFAFQNSMINISFSRATTGTLIYNTLQTAASAAGIKPGLTNPDVIAGLATKNYNAGIVLSGSVIKGLQKFCDTNDINWTIENGQLNAVKYGDPLLRPIVFVNPNTGLIGIPQQRAIDRSAASLISFKTLLNPEIGLFQFVVLTSKFVKGPYVTATVTHIGDTYALDWYTECEAT